VGQVQEAASRGTTASARGVWKKAPKCGRRIDFACIGGKRRNVLEAGKQAPELTTQMKSIQPVLIRSFYLDSVS